MCGIAGLVGKKCQPLKNEMDKMLECIRHRGPDGGGQWSEGMLLLGHRRLAILDLTSDGEQPMLYGDRYVLVFNGEIYNYKELRAELEEKGYYFRTQTDSEVIPAAYDCWGTNCQKKMNGMWAFALYDRKDKKLFCSRDRFGIKPFYYFENEERFAFASEIKQLLTVTQEDPKANRTILEIFLSVGYRDFSEQTMFQGILQLRGGYCFTYDICTQKLNLERWFDPLEIKNCSMKSDEAICTFETHFSNAIDRHLRADVEIGSCLSGGLDSSAIVCAVNRKLQAMEKRNVQRTISSCFNDIRYDEREYINAVIQECKDIQSEKVFPAMDELLPSLHKMMWHMDEPFSSTSIFAQWNVFQKAHDLGLKVMLDGQGADEQLAGYTDFYKMLFVWLFRHGRLIRLGRELQAYFRLRAKTEKKSQLRFLAITLLEAFTPIYVQERIFRFYRRKDADERGISLSKRTLGEMCAVKRQYAKRNPQKYICAHMEIGMSELLHYEDRNSMAFSVEARVPFLDAKLSASLMKIPLRYKLRDGKTKWVMREALKDILPSKVMGRYDKMGFVTPEFDWFSNHHEDLEPYMLQAAKLLEPVVCTEKFMHWYHSPAAKKHGDLYAWRVLCAAEWVRVFQVKI